MNVLQILIIIKQLNFTGSVSLNEMDWGRPPDTATQSVSPGRVIYIDYDVDGNPRNYAVDNLHNFIWWPWWGIFVEPWLKVTLRTPFVGLSLYLMSQKLGFNGQCIIIRFRVKRCMSLYNRGGFIEKGRWKWKTGRMLPPQADQF